MSTATKRLRENLTSATALVVIGISILGFAFGVPNMWLVLVLGLLVVVPLVGLLFGDDDWRKWDPLSDEFWEDIFGEETESKQDGVSREATSTQDALSTLRTRYAAGELTDEQFERKLERLLETETPEDVEELLTE